MTVFVPAWEYMCGRIQPETHFNSKRGCGYGCHLTELLKTEIATNKNQGLGISKLA